MTYNEKLNAAQKVLDYKDMLFRGPDLLKIMSLVSYLTIALRKKNPEIKPYDVLVKAGDSENDSKIMKEIFEMISINCDLFLNAEEQDYHLYGCKTSKEILELINKLLNNWIPF